MTAFDDILNQRKGTFITFTPLKKGQNPLVRPSSGKTDLKQQQKENISKVIQRKEGVKKPINFFSNFGGFDFLLIKRKFGF